jgi:hypothetical protein
VVQQPIRFDATAKSLREDAQALIGATAAAWDAVVASVKTPDEATFGNTIEPIFRDEIERSENQRALRFCATTPPQAELRNASNLAINLFDEAEVYQFSRRDVFLLSEGVFVRPRHWMRNAPTTSTGYISASGSMDVV